MKLTKKLLGYLNRVFNKSPLEFRALSLAYAGGDVTWQIADGVLTTSVAGGQGANLSIDLSAFTIDGLVSHIAAQPGYTTTYLNAENKALSALVLMDGSGDLASSGGGDLYGYSSVLWAYMEANAAELQAAETAIQALAGEMQTTTADTIWLDLLGQYYKVPRLNGEDDASYGPRIVATVIRPASNNVAIEQAIELWTGQTATVTDVVLRGVTGDVYNGEFEHNSAIEHNAVNTNVYGLFDVTYGYDLLNGGDLTQFQTTVLSLVNTLRAAGTHLRAIALTGSVLTDSLNPPTDSFSLIKVASAFTDTLNAPSDAVSVMPVTMGAFSDALTAPTDGLVSLEHHSYTYGGVRTHNSVASYDSGEYYLSSPATIDWNFRKGSLDSSLTFTRASTGTYFDSSGILRTATANAPRFDHDPATGIARGLLMEESRTNLLLYSGDLSKTSWGKSNCTVTQGVVLAPDGTMTGNVVTRTAVGNHYLYQNVTATPAGLAYSFSVWLKAGTYSGGVRVWLKDGSGTSLGAVDVTPTSAWTRYTFSGTFSSTAASNIGVYIDPDNDTGVAGDTFYVWGAQLELGAFATSYIPTTSASVTRAADGLSTTSFSWFNAVSGTLAVEVAVMSTLASGTSFAAVDNGSTNGLMLYKGSGGSGVIGYSGTGSASVSGASYVNGQVIRAALAYSGSGASAYVSGLGQAAAAITGSAVSATTFWLGSGRGNFLMSGWIRRFTYLNYALDPTPLKLLTSA